MRKYLYSIVESERFGQQRFHLYISAIKKFSIKEMLAKQLWAMTHVIDLPFNEITISMGASREASTHTVYIHSPRSAAFNYGLITVKKEEKIVEIVVNNILEFVFFNKEHVEPFLELVQGKWKGDWDEIKEMDHGET